jgi:hypothetical protein
MLKMVCHAIALGVTLTDGALHAQYLENHHCSCRNRIGGHGVRAVDGRTVGAGTAPAGPNLTAGVGFANGTLARTNLGKVNWESNLNGFTVQLKTHDNADVEVTSGSGIAGGNSGWHYQQIRIRRHRQQTP